jgi:D-glycero-D-manno-heptose 1,7-bisphosphate phosphatase
MRKSRCRGMDSSRVAGWLDVGLWAERLTTHNFVGRPALFLDRDGVVVEDAHYLHKVEEVALISGVAGAIVEANRAAIPVVIITNQAGIGRGYYDWYAFIEVQKVMIDHLLKKGASIDMVLACAYHEKGVGAFRVPNHPWRKPNCGMFQEARRVLGIDLTQSFIIGDTISDLKAGMAAGLPGGALTLTGHGKLESAKHCALLDEWRAQSIFNARVVESAATAIYNWLQEHLCGIKDNTRDACR